MLEYLALAKGRTCSRSTLLREVWQMPADAGTNVVDVYVNYLRKKLAAALVAGTGIMAGADRVIETIRGEGYAMPAVTERRPMGVVGPLGLPVSSSFLPASQDLLHVPSPFGTGVRAIA